MTTYQTAGAQWNLVWGPGSSDQVVGSNTDGIPTSIEVRIAAIIDPSASSPSSTTATLPSVNTTPISGRDLEVRPTTIALSGDSGNIPTHLSWSSWTATGAVGSGTVDVQGCVPSCAYGSQTETPVTIRLSAPVGGVFSVLVETISGQSPQAYTLPT